MYNPLKLKNYIPFYFRKRFKNKYIIIESDDWGMAGSMEKDGIRYLESKYGYENFTRWTKDSLETLEDVSLLYEVLNKFRNSFYSQPVVTPNFITHNINYNESQNLSFISIGESLLQNPRLKNIYLEGVDKGMLYPQLHGYCHYDTEKLELFFNSFEGRELFKHRFLTGKSTIKGYLNDFRSELTFDSETIEKKLKLAIDEFFLLFGYHPTSLIPPHFIIEPKLFNSIKMQGIKCIQGSNRLTDNNGNRLLKIFFRRQNGLYWFPRNARLDPHPDYGYYHDECLESIKNAFDSRMPAIIDFHRVNIAGRFNKSYRDRSLNELDKTLIAIEKNWADARFISTPELLKLCQT